MVIVLKPVVCCTRMRWQREAGLMSRERRVWLAARPRCESASGGFVSIGFIDVLPALEVSFSFYYVTSQSGQNVRMLFLSGWFLVLALIAQLHD